MRSTARENYLKTIFEIQQGQDEDTVNIGRLAEALKLTSGTVTAMVKKLAQEKFLKHEAYVGCKLTAKGRAQAIEMLRRHRILELFLVSVLGLDWSEVHEEAEHLEHAISARVLASMEKLLNYPTTDPHGDPIPSTDGEIAILPHICLSDCQAGDQCEVTRILDESKEFLQFIGSMGLYPGTPISVEKILPAAGIVEIKSGGGQRVSLGLVPAEKLLVRHTNK
jgi:DtxR family transcriptional regulator, Mn-dependent transcriptional regulator